MTTAVVERRNGFRYHGHMAGSRRAPISGLLNRLLGAQGVLWLFVLSAGALWWSAQEAWLFVVEPAPRRTITNNVLAGEASQGQWLEVCGLTLSLSPHLVGPFAEPVEVSIEEAAMVHPRVLLDPRDPATEFWRSLALAAQAVKPDDFGRAMAGESMPHLDLIESRWLAPLRKVNGAESSQQQSLLPRGALLLRHPWAAPPPPAPGADAKADHGPVESAPDEPLAAVMQASWRQLRLFVRAARLGIEADSRVRGRLEKNFDLSAEARTRALGITIGGVALRLGARPRSLPFGVAVVASLVLLLLVAGFSIPPRTAPQ